ncbi:MAG: hypothetical protein EXQ87_11800 [Alphaproteobacteria bacterium]|nr:hypothetical protein [Alphaproteobacteria bacterium]
MKDDKHMKLTRFRVQNYRTVDDSDWITVNEITALVGQNESGKSNLCEALYRANPYVKADYTFDEDWPVSNWGGRDRTAVVCTAEFELTDQTEIETLFNAMGLTESTPAPAATGDGTQEAEAVPTVPNMPDKLVLWVSKNYENKRRFEINDGSRGFRELDAAKAESWAQAHLPKCVFICEIASNRDPTLRWPQAIGRTIRLTAFEGSRLDAKRDPSGIDYSPMNTVCYRASRVGSRLDAILQPRRRGRYPRRPPPGYRRHCRHSSY